MAGAISEGRYGYRFAENIVVLHILQKVKPGERILPRNFASGRDYRWEADRGAATVLLATTAREWERKGAPTRDPNTAGSGHARAAVDKDSLAVSDSPP